jgi:branched-chain amino acid aminotransferase
MPVPRFAYYRGRVGAYEDARVGLLTHGLNYGTGAFAGLRGYWNEDDEQLYVFRPLDHFRRLLESSRLLRMQLGVTEAGLLDALTSLLRAEDLRTDCYIRALVFYGDEVIGIRLHGLTPDVSMVAVPFGRYIATEDGAHLTFSSWCRVDDNVIPPRGKITGSYANSAFIKSDAELAGFDEAIVLNRAGQVSEGSAENVFVVRRGLVVTPPVTGGILEGVTRRTVIHLLRAELSVPVEERPIDRSEVYLADELFLTGTAAQITPATRVDHRPIGIGAVGPITAGIERLFADAVRGRLARYHEWCHAVYETERGASREAAVA